MCKSDRSDSKIHNALADIPGRFTLWLGCICLLEAIIEWLLANRSVYKQCSDVKLTILEDVTLGGARTIINREQSGSLSRHSCVYRFDGMQKSVVE